MEIAAADPERAAFRRLTGWQRQVAALLAVGLSAYALYWVHFVVQPQVYRVSFLLLALSALFLLTPGSRRSAPDRVQMTDWLLVLATVTALAWPFVDFERFVRRAAEPRALDLVFGSATILLVLEATRRAVGWILPLTAVGFLLYAWLGPYFDVIGLPLIAHRGYGVERLVGALYMSLEGIFGVPLDVAATYIILFTIYGAVLESSGAGTFFVEWAMRASGPSGAAAGRSVAVAGFLLGTVSGSGVATTVTLGSIAWPMLRRAGYAAEPAGAMLSAAGIGALLSPPTMGAAAFLIAEFLRISYLQVLVMATVPTILYYVSIWLMIEGERAPVGRTVPIRQTPDREPAAGSARGYFHFTSLVAIAVFMVAGMSAFRAVFWATVLAIGLSFLQEDTALTPRRLFAALRAGGVDVLGVAATTATAGIVVGVVTLTGLGLKIAGLIVALAGGTLVLTVIYSAVAVWLLGLAVPVTASYIIAAVMVAPALVRSGVPDVAAHMFIFYYAVLSEVSPPTALSPFAAAALTGGNPFRTMALTWKYTMPAFVVPFVFTLTPGGAGVLFHGTPFAIASASCLALAGTSLLALALGGRVRARLTGLERVVLGGAGGVCLFAGWPAAVVAASISAVVLLLQFIRASPAPES